MLNQHLPPSSLNAMVIGRYGPMLYNRHDTFIGRSLEKYGEWSEPEVVLFSALLTPGDIVVEVGANIGSHTVPLAQKVGPSGRVIAFEPQRIVYQNLCANIALNSLTNVEALQIALGDHEGQVLIPDIDYSVEGNYGAINLEQFKQGSPVRLTTLDAILKVPRLKLLKVDVEGMEIGMIQGARGIIAEHKPILYVENDRVAHSADLIRLIQSLGYRLYWHTPLIFNANNFAGDPENLYPRLASFNMLCIHASVGLQVNGLEEILNPEQHPLKKAE